MCSVQVPGAVRFVLAIIIVICYLKSQHYHARINTRKMPFRFVTWLGLLLSFDFKFKFKFRFKFKFKLCAYGHALALSLAPGTAH